MRLDRSSDLPLYRQLYDQLRAQILAGAFAPENRLPASRSLASELGVGRVTVVQAYKQLEAEGFIVQRRGAGAFVEQALPAVDAAQGDGYAPRLSSWGRRAAAAAASGAPRGAGLEIDFGFGRSFPHIFPYDTWRRLLARYLSTDDIMLARYGSAAGFMPLREALAAYLARQRGVRCTAEQVVIVSGAQQALDILGRLLFPADAEVLVESPGYRDAFAIFELNGARLRALAVDEHGFPVERIAQDYKPTLVFVTPCNQFPRGGAMPLERRMALLDWAADAGALIVEDDYDGELRYDGHPLSALQGLDRRGQVIYLGTFSKVLFPALRLGYVVLPEQFVDPFVRAKELVDRGAPTLTQAAVADFITEGHFDRHLRHLRSVYGRRHAVLIEALDAHMPAEVAYARVPAGLHVMLFLPPEMDEKELIRRAAEAGVGVYGGAPYHRHAPAPPSVLLGFSGLDEAEIAEGVRRLGDIVSQA